jgi:GAF domain-containing protein
MKVEIVNTSVQRAMQMLDEGIATHKILTHLVDTAEQVNGGDSVSSILVLDKDGLLRNGASPKLPYDYLTAIDGLKPNASVGTCAAVAATGVMVITSDFRDDDKWGELRHLPLALGFVCAWSVPIKSDNGKILGTFGTYFREKRQPSHDEIAAVNILASAAARALNYSNIA